MINILKKAGLLFTLIALPIAALAGPVPWTMGQFPQWFATQTTPVSITNAAETDLLVLPLPASVMGNLGFMQVTLIADGDGGATNHILTGYIGGPGHTNSTAMWTNNYLQSIATPITTTIVPYIGGFSNIVYSTRFTNFNAGATVQTKVVGTQTNGLFLTITGATGDTHGTYLTLDGALVQALSQ